MSESEGLADGSVVWTPCSQLGISCMRLTPAKRGPPRQSVQAAVDVDPASSPTRYVSGGRPIRMLPSYVQRSIACTMSV